MASNHVSNGRHERIDNFAHLLGGMKSGEAPHYKGARISWKTVNVLTQPRQTFEEIAELAQDIAKKNLLNPLTVAKFTAKECEEYLEVVNRLWDTKFSRSELNSVRENGKRRFYVLLAGERRLRAIRHLEEHGCAECNEKYGEERSGRCFKRHFRSDLIDVRLCLGIAPISALFLQLSENTHMPVPAYEEARAYAELYRIVSQSNGGFPVARFAREVGRSPDTVRNALRFVHLPEDIQEAVAKGYIAYGIAVEIARLKEANPEEDFWYWVRRAVAEKLNTVDFRKLVSQYLSYRLNGQLSLPEIMSGASEAEVRKAHIRRTVAKETVQDIWRAIYYMENGSSAFQRWEAWPTRFTVLGKKSTTRLPSVHRRTGSSVRSLQAAPQRRGVRAGARSDLEDEGTRSYARWGSSR